MCKKLSANILPSQRMAGNKILRSSSSDNDLVHVIIWLRDSPSNKLLITYTNYNHMTLPNINHFYRKILQNSPTWAKFGFPREGAKLKLTGILLKMQPDSHFLIKLVFFPFQYWSAHTSFVSIQRPNYCH